MITLVGFFATVTFPPPVAAETTTAAEFAADELPRVVEDRMRVRWIQDQLDRTQPRMRWWYWGWFSGYGAITMGRLGMWALADTPADRAENAVGAATSFLGVGGLVISPLRKHLSDGNDLRAHAATSPAEWAGKRAAAETLLRTQAAAQRRGKHWGNRMLSASVPIGAGLVLWLAYDLPVQAAIATASGLVVGQTQIITQPDHAVSQWQQYQSGAWRRPPSPSTSWHLTPMPGGIQLTLRF